MWKLIVSVPTTHFFHVFSSLVFVLSLSYVNNRETRVAIIQFVQPHPHVSFLPHKHHHITSFQVSSSLVLSCCGVAVLAGVIYDYGHHQFDDQPHGQHVAEQKPQHLQHQQHHYDADVPASLHKQSHQQPIVEHQHLSQHEAEPSKTNHDHKVEHKHATSHQSFKIHHFHPVPVYVKKDKHPIEIGGVKHKLKVSAGLI